MLNEEDEDQVEAYYKEKYASGHTTRYNTVHVHVMMYMYMYVYVMYMYMYMYTSVANVRCTCCTGIVHDMTCTVHVKLSYNILQCTHVLVH